MKEQLPGDIRDLTASILGTGRTGAEDLRNSAEQLLARRGDPYWSVENLDETISQLKADLDGAKDAREQLRAELARVQAAASESHQLPSGFAGPLGEIAMQLAEAREVDGWLSDQVSGPIPITHDEIAELCELRGRVRDIDESLISMYLPAGDDLPSVERLQAVARHRTDAEKALDRLDGDLSIAERLLEFGVDLSRLEQLLQSHDDADRAVRRRSTRSPGRPAASSAIVVRRGLPRTAPRRPRSRISRSMVQRATRWPSRFNWAHTFGAP